MPSLFFTTNPTKLLVLSLLTTTSFEFLVYWLAFKKNPLKLLFYSVFINFLTLPTAKYLYDRRLIGFYPLEALVVLVESFFIMALMKVSYKKALFVSFVANLITALFGLYWTAQFKRFLRSKGRFILQ